MNVETTEPLSEPKPASEVLVNEPEPAAPAPQPEPAADPEQEQPDPEQPELISEPSPVASAPPVKKPGQDNWTAEDWRKVDWSKKNAEIARVMGVSRQRVSQIRKELQGDSSAATSDIHWDDIRPAQSQPSPEPQVDVAAQAAAMLAKYRQTSEFLFDTTTGTLAAVFGEEWLPRRMENNGQVIDERENMVSALQNYVQTKNVPDLPPGWILVILAGIYAAPRLRAPSTKTKLQGIFIWSKSKVGNVFRMFKRTKVT